MDLNHIEQALEGKTDFEKIRFLKAHQDDASVAEILALLLSSLYSRSLVDDIHFWATDWLPKHAESSGFPEVLALLLKAEGGTQYVPRAVAWLNNHSQILDAAIPLKVLASVEPSPAVFHCAVQYLRHRPIHHFAEGVIEALLKTRAADGIDIACEWIRTNLDWRQTPKCLVTALLLCQDRCLVDVALEWCNINPQNIHLADVLSTLVICEPNDDLLTSILSWLSKNSDSPAAPLVYSRLLLSSIGSGARAGRAIEAAIGWIRSHQSDTHMPNVLNSVLSVGRTEQVVSLAEDWLSKHPRHPLSSKIALKLA